MSRPGSSQQAPHPRPRRRGITADLISGTILVSVFIAVADEADARLAVLGVTAVSMLVVWLSQVFVVAITMESGWVGRSPAVTPVIKGGFQRSNGILIAAVPPLLVLACGTVGLIDGQVAYWLALWMGTVILAVLGWIAFTSPGSRWGWRLFGAVVTAGFGMIIIGLRVLIS